MKKQYKNQKSLALSLMRLGENGLLMLGASTALIAREQEDKM